MKSGSNTLLSGTWKSLLTDETFLSSIQLIRATLKRSWYGFHSFKFPGEHLRLNFLLNIFTSPITLFHLTYDGYFYDFFTLQTILIYKYWKVLCWTINPVSINFYHSKLLKKCQATIMPKSEHKMIG